MSDIQILKYANGQSRMRGFDIPADTAVSARIAAGGISDGDGGRDCFSVTVIHDFSETVVGKHESGLFSNDAPRRVIWLLKFFPAGQRSPIREIRH